MKKHLKKEDYVIFKLDVEGAEYGILRYYNQIPMTIILMMILIKMIMMMLMMMMMRMMVVMMILTKMFLMQRCR